MSASLPQETVDALCLHRGHEVHDAVDVFETFAPALVLAPAPRLEILRRFFCKGALTPVQHAKSQDVSVK